MAVQLSEPTSLCWDNKVVVHIAHNDIFHELSAKVFLSIDCGSSSSQPHTDANSIEWVGDDPYVRSGETHKVEVAPSSLSTTTWDSQVMSTLRAFPTRRGNCYSIDIEDTTTAERVLVRATFYYGNYDKKANPPNFLLQFNGNNWARIETSMSGIEYKEVAYSLNNGNNINICLAQTLSSNIPFISALEVRSLDSKVYSNIGSNYPLFFMTRNAFTKTDIRFPEDSFDRIWHTTAPPTGLITVASNSPSIIVETDDKPPEAVLRAALTSTLTRNHITYSGFADPKYPVHFNAYFSEVIELSSTQKRSMDISVDNKLINSIIVPKGPVIPPYGRALEVHIPNITSAYTIAFKPTDDSTLPPLINALEGFVIGDALVQGTNSDDVKALVLLQTTYIQLQYWSGDPCLPSLLYNWEWIECTYDTDSPRVTALYLSGYELTGILPDFSGMDALETINLSNNSLTQAIPEFLGTFPKLKTL
ncbi:probable LRR receptor-like serine/threonine-protein kinase At1g05700 [Papaver somniferum]|uniref:probable LRR receptor-like serine/threonine-protein kinase At1g05700 n=1 Tax=Papaver somniferum TaxID=3469 RepID=UPI000E6F92DE|nr:probable LRR receptor-like serine/threonine-protein kinase At1g05700 [Papaver somniferum]